MSNVSYCHETRTPLAFLQYRPRMERGGKEGSERRGREKGGERVDNKIEES